MYLLIISIIFSILILSLIFYIYKSRYFLDTKNYTELCEIENSWEIISQEIPPFNENNINFKRNKNDWNNESGKELANTIKSEWCSGWQNEYEWFNFPLIYHGKIIDKSGEMCPNTIKLLLNLPSINIAGFSLLKPNTRLNEHTDEAGSKNNSLAANLLLTNSDASLHVNGLSKQHTRGKFIIFDSNYLHYADNKSDHNRIILYIEFKTNVIIGSRYNGIGLGSKIGFPTINIKLINKVPAGFYLSDNATIIVKNNGTAECHYKVFDKSLDLQKIIYIENIKRIVGEKESIIDIFDKGCM